MRNAERRILSHTISMPASSTGPSALLCEPESQCSRLRLCLIYCAGTNSSILTTQTTLREPKRLRQHCVQLASLRALKTISHLQSRGEAPAQAENSVSRAGAAAARALSAASLRDGRDRPWRAGYISGGRNRRGVGLDARRALQGRQTLRAVWLAILSKFLSVLRRVSVCRMQMCAIKASMVPT